MIESNGTPLYPAKITPEFVKDTIALPLTDIPPEIQMAIVQYIINFVYTSKKVSRIYENATTSEPKKADLRLHQERLFQITAELILALEERCLKVRLSHHQPFSYDIIRTKIIIHDDKLLTPSPELESGSNKIPQVIRKRFTPALDLKPDCIGIRQSISARMQKCIKDEESNAGKLIYFFIHRLAMIAISMAEFQYLPDVAYEKHKLSDKQLGAKNANNRVNLDDYLKLTTEVLCSNFAPDLKFSE